MFTVTLQCYSIRFPFLSHHFQDKYNHPCFIILCSDTLSQLPNPLLYTRPTTTTHRMILLLYFIYYDNRIELLGTVTMSSRARGHFLFLRRQTKQGNAAFSQNLREGNWFSQRVCTTNDGGGGYKMMVVTR